MKSEKTENKERGELAIVLGDDRLVLSPRFKRIARVESALGRSLVTVMSEMTQGRGMSTNELATTIYLLADQPKPTVDEIGEMITESGLMKVLPQMEAVFERIFYGGGKSQGKAPPEDE